MTVHICAVLLSLSAASLAAVDLTDRQIADAVDDRLRNDLAGPCEAIDVDAANGLVTLSGRVSHLPARDRAIALAETVKGVRAVINRVQVAPAVGRGDETVRRDVEKALLFDAATQSLQLKVRVSDGVVTLTGAARTWREKELAGAAARGVIGVVDVQNAIQSADSADRTDEQIAAEIRQALRWDALIDHALIDVRVINGDVRLSGVVGSAAEFSLARRSAWVVGVDAVDAWQLQVRHWARQKELRQDKFAPPATAELEEAVRDVLRRDPRIGPFGVTVEAEGLSVTLRGNVGTLWARRVAEQDARQTVGVSSVVNRLKVRPKGLVDDAQTAVEIRQALHRDPYLTGRAIHVVVDGGAARLTGSVDNHFERARADDLACMAQGVLAVHNGLLVDLAGLPFTYDPYVDAIDPHSYVWYEHQPRLTFRQDDAVRESIGARLRCCPFVNADSLRLSVRSGVATLAGTVGSPVQRRTAVEHAYAGGASWVIDELRVQAEPGEGEMTGMAEAYR